jgi:hypothetical protein
MPSSLWRSRLRLFISKRPPETKLSWCMRITFAFNSGVVYVFGCFPCVSSEFFLVFKFILVLLVKTFQVCFVKTVVLFAHYKVDNFLYKNLILLLLYFILP